MRGRFKRGGFKAKNTSKNKQIEVSFFLIDSEKVGIQIPYGYCVQSVKNYIRDVGQGVWSSDDKCWSINRDSYPEVLQKVQDHFFRVNNQQESNEKIIKVNQIEDFVFKAEEMLEKQLQQIQIVNLKPYNNIQIKYNSIQTNIEPQSLPFYKKLFDFQKECLQFGIQKHGRMLLADEMGVGKTIQSLAVAYIYKHEWPLLIICPPTLKINWQNQIKRWYPDIQPHSIQLINHAKTAFKVNVSVMIISYDLAWRMKQMFDHIKVVIADEAHYLKSSDSKRSEILVPFLSTRKRVILLTGTPAFARPKQIYNLISIVRPGLYKNFKLFGNRYCDPKWNHWSHNYEYNGCKNVKQLYYMLKGKIMIRRLKAEVLTQLPDKNRQKVVLQTDSSVVKSIKQVLQKNNISKMETFFSQFINNAGSFQQSTVDKREQVMQAYRLSGMAKIKAVREYIDQILQNKIKILVFAHHIKVMDQIQAELRNKKHKFMRIDGSVSQIQRANNVDRFQNDPQILVALLSITAAGIGITLTAASTVIFAQLHWTPALMIQAQDRAHRVGQKDSVNCHYLIGENTLDEMLYKFLEKKVLNVSSFIDGQSKDLQFQELEKGQKGKFSKKQSSSAFIPKNKLHFGLNLMPQPSYQNSEGQLEQASQISQFTDISESSCGRTIIGSRKRVPTSNLDSFLLKKKQISEMSELKYVQAEDDFSQKYQGRTSLIVNDHYQPKTKNRQDSDCQFEEVLETYLKSRDSSKPSSLRQEQLQKVENLSGSNKQIDLQSQKQTVSIKGKQDSWQIDI